MDQAFDEELIQLDVEPVRNELRRKKAAESVTQARELLLEGGRRHVAGAFAEDDFAQGHAQEALKLAGASIQSNSSGVMP